MAWVSKKTCTIDGCSKFVLAREMCGTHYERWRSNAGYHKPCCADGCALPGSKAGYCHKHYRRLRVYGDPLGGGPFWNPDRTCKAVGCTRERSLYGYCPLHYYRWSRYGDPLYAVREKGRKPCIIDGCNKRRVGFGYCSMHYRRFKVYGDPHKLRSRPDGTGGISSSGYRIITAHGHPNANKHGKIAEHRYVMSQMLGRSLYPDETVHHKNGARLDNRPDNLELWVKKHCPGQRVSDLLAWAQQIIERYSALEVA